jgi:hypothetical protein
MKTFTIENDTNNIILNASGKEAELVPDSERFNSEAALAKLAANWPAARLVDIWNSLPGATPAKKFKDRATAVSRIWKALQTLGEAAPAAKRPHRFQKWPPPLSSPRPLRSPRRSRAKRLSRKGPCRSPPNPTLLRPLRHKRLTLRRRRLPRRQKATRAKKAPVAAKNADVPR